MNSADRWLDINALSDEQAAARKSAQDESGHSSSISTATRRIARTRVFALRPTPIVVNWFGFPGTMGSPYHHYIIADESMSFRRRARLLLRESRKTFLLPAQRPQAASPRRSSRGAADEGLPDDGFVYCCLNGMQKTTPPIFSAWMSILTQTPGSVLWLLGGGDETNARLQGLAAQSGVAPERLIFAAKKANPEHLARYVLADVFLDTFPYGAHTTAADAMWMGVPIVTMPGKSFASRVCAGLAKAGGIGELVCPTLEIYVARAVELGRNPRQVSALKQKLVAGRQSSLLFDTPRLVRELEGLYRGMWEDFQRGRRPVPDLSNLDAYHEIALDLGLENRVPSEPDDYRRVYQDRLAVRHRIDPIRPDFRLWRNGK